MVQPHHHHHDGTKSSKEPSYNIFRDSFRECKMSIYLSNHKMCPEKNDDV